MLAVTTEEDSQNQHKPSRTGSATVAAANPSQNTESSNNKDGTETSAESVAVDTSSNEAGQALSQDYASEQADDDSDDVAATPMPQKKLIKVCHMESKFWSEFENGVSFFKKKKRKRKRQQKAGRGDPQREK